jgi:hypothetical protein
VLVLLFAYIKPAYPAAVFLVTLLIWIAGWFWVFKKIKHKTGFFLSLLLLLLFTWFALHLTFVQNWVISKVTGTLSEKLHTRISIQHIDLDFFDKLDLQGLYVEDQKKDTLLYAGTASINITDWFFLKDKASIRYLSLSDATINMNRSDTVWNYQFLIDYFASPKKDTTKKGGIEFSLKELKLQNIVFNKVDQWKGEDMLGSLKSLTLLADTFDLAKQHIHINSLNIDGPHFTIADYTGERERLNRMPAPQPKDTTKKKNGGLVLQVKHLHISNGLFTNGKKYLARTAYADMFDGEHIEFGKINADFKNVRFANDTLTTAITLATKERSGFEVKKLQANMRFSPEIMEFNDLDLLTNKSRLGNYYSMRYDDFNNDMGHFLHNIKLEGNFVNSELNSDDLAFFTPDVKTWKRVFEISGHVKGTVDNLTAKKMLIKSGNSSINGDITMKGLPDIETTFIDFAARDLQTNYTDLTSIIPSLKEVDQPKLSRLGNINYKGNFTGFINDFVAFGTISTSLGTITGDLNLKLPEKRPAVYSGKILTQDFRLGQFIDNSKVGSVTFSGKVNGSGFSAKTLDAKFDGNVRSIGYDGYNYQNITLNGNFKKNLFNGNASINDPHLKLDDLTGSIDFNGELPAFNFDALLAKADFKKLGLTKEEFELKGRFNINFTGDNIDNFLGAAQIREAGLLHNGVPLSFDSLVLESQIVDGQKHLSIRSNEVDGHVAGNFTIQELPDAFAVFLNRYYPAYIKKPSYAGSDQDFTFEIKTKTIDDYIGLIDKKLKGFNNSTFSGNLKLKNNELNVNADIPQFSYDGKVFNNVLLQGKGNFDSLATRVTVEDVAITDSMHLSFVDLVFNSSKDTSIIGLKTSASKTISDASVNARLVTMNNGVKIHFFPSSFIINDNKWQLERDGEIEINNSLVSASDVKFIQGNQQIKISTEPSETLTTNDIVVELTKVHVDDFTSLALKQPALQGQISGIIKIEDPFGKPLAYYDTYIDEFRADNDSIGVLKAKGIYNISEGTLSIKASSDNVNNKLNIDGTIHLKDSTGSQTKILVQSEKFDLALLNSFLGGLFSDIKGSANTSDLTFSSNGKNILLTGTANLNEGSLVVNYTQCKYNFKNESIVFNPDEIDFGEIKLRDTLNNEATLSGKMYHRFFDQIEFDNIFLKTDRLLVLNTTKRDNSQFYGKVVGKASMSITGDQNSIVMDINGEPSRRDSSHIYIVSGNSIENEAIDYIDFIQFGTEMEEKFKSKSAGSILVNMELTANPSCKVDVILDEATGDVIKGEGDGLLKIRVGNKEDLTINGRYDITRGEYTFNFQTFLKKYFTVNSGSLVWDGDPYMAKIDIVAEYLATNVDFSTLSVSNSLTGGTSSFNQKSNLRVLAHLTETLLKPAIDFELQLPANTGITDFLVLKRLEQFTQDKNEMNKQITSLLLFNSFINTNQGFLTASGGYSVLSNTIGGVVSGAISGFFNTLLQKYVKNLSFNFDLNSSLSNDLQANVEKLQAAARSNFVYTLLNGRLIISAGLNLDYNNPYANINRNSNVLITPDITVEWILSKSGRLRVVGFNRTNYDLVGQRNRTGVSLSYRRDFERLPGIFAKALFFEWGRRNRERKAAN